MLRKIFLSALISLILWREVYSVDCSTGTTSTSCGKISGCTWQSGSCVCASQVAMDILFALDSSGSIGSTAFKTEKTFLSNLVYSGLAQEARIDIIRFSSAVDVLLTFPTSTTMSTAQLATFVNNIVYNGGATDTVGAIDEAIDQFDLYSSANRSKVLVLVTDGNPNAPNGNNNVCAYSSTLKAKDIEVVIIGVGSSWTPALLDCLVTSDDNIIYVDDFTASDFDSILPQITAITCPVTYNLILTEIQVDPAEKNNNLTGSRFIEIYNPSTEVTLTDLSLTGLFTGTITTDSSIKLKQNQYLVIYDPPPSVPDYPNCIDCGCTLNKTTGHNWCSNSLYLPCNSTKGCVVDKTMNKTNFYQRLIDDSVFLEIDYITWTSAWPTTITGYSSYLKGKLYDNSLGSNWAMSCNVKGTPGSDPINCTATCDSDDYCKLNGNVNGSCNSKGTGCDCSDGYYASGITCYPIPPPGDCYAYWLKNGTVQYAQYIWDKANTDIDITYKLDYYSSSSGDLDTITSSARTRFIIDYQWNRGPDAIAGSVRTAVGTATSTSVNCTVVTSAPTSSPSTSPTKQPSNVPTRHPTTPPTPETPHIYIAGDICEYDRCDCYGGSWSCIGDDVYKEYAETEASVDTYITIRKWPSDSTYLTTVCWSITPQGEYNSSTVDDDGSSSSSSNRRVLYNKNGQRKLLTTFSTTDMSTTSIENNDITPTQGCLVFNNTFEEKIVLKIIEESDIVNSATDSEYELFLLKILNCSVVSNISCEIVYPSSLYMIIQDTNGDSFNSSSSEKEMPWWLWWVIGALILFLILLAWLVYRYWWKNKQTGQQLAETEAQLDDQVAENELGFGNDLGQGDVGFNPLATGVPNTSKAPAFGAELDARKAGNANNNVDVNVEKFSHREEYGQAKPGRKGNNLNEPLLGNGY